MGLRENLKNFVKDLKISVDKNDPDLIGVVSGPEFYQGPNSRIFNIINRGIGNCAAKTEIIDHTGFPYKVSEPYILTGIKDGSYEERQVTRSWGETVELICITDFALSPADNSTVDTAHQTLLISKNT